MDFYLTHPLFLTPSSLDYVKAKAEKGDRDAQRELGYHYCKSYVPGVSEIESMDEPYKSVWIDAVQSNVEAVKWFKMAALQGDAQAQFELSECYSGKRGLKADFSEAAKWCRLSAEQDFPDAQFKLGKLYGCGEGVPEDQKEASVWYGKAAQRYHADAQYAVGQSFLDKKVSVPGAAWIRAAAYQGHGRALIVLGNCHLNAFGVIKDEVEGYACYNLACVGPWDFEARKLLAELEEKLPYDVRLKGQQRTKELEKEIKEKTDAIWAANSKKRSAQRDAVLKGKPDGIDSPSATEAVAPPLPVQTAKPEATGLFFCWAVSSVAIFAFLCAIGFLNSGAQGFAVFFGRGLILAPLGGLVVGGIWKMLSK
jgi:hypothetical protein